MSGDPGSGVMCALHEQALKNITDSLARIEAQTTATNGRLRSLERWRIGLATALGGIAVGAVGGSELLQKIIAAVVGAG